MGATSYLRRRPALIGYVADEPWRSVTYLGTLILLKLLLQFSLYRRGFISVAADEFARGLRAARWALEPRLDLIADVQDVWLPFEKYLNGILLWLWPDVILAPRATVFIASCLLLVFLFILVRVLFQRFVVAALSTAFIAFQPWYAWLSGTPMLEMYYLACFFAGLIFLVRWLQEKRRGYWLFSGLCFMLASGFHVQSWIYINLVNLLTVGFLIGFLAQRHYRYAGQLLGHYVLSNVFILVYVAAEFLVRGELFSFLAGHTSYSLWYYNGYDVPAITKFLYYPHLIVGHVSGVVWILLAIGLVFLWADKNRFWKLLPLAIALLALSINSVLNVFSGPPSAAPARYSLFYIVMLSPYVAFGAYSLFRWGRQRPNPFLATTLPALAVCLFAYGVWWGLARIPHYPRGMPLDAVATGHYLRDVLAKEESSEENAVYMVELKYWEFLAIQLTARHYDNAVFDREDDLLNRDTPSIFLEPPANIHAALLSENVRYVALQDPALKEKAGLAGFLRQEKDIGSWTVFKFELFSK